MIDIGFTGTQRGLTPPQAERVRELLRHRDFVGHHGGCVGADAEFDGISRAASWFRWMVVYPSTVEKKRAAIVRVPVDIHHPPQSPLVRNRAIVDAVTRMIACPGESVQRTRSGTWATIRYARSVNRALAVVFPSGAVAYDGEPWT